MESVLEKLFEIFPHRHDAVTYCVLGATAHFSNLHIAEIVQRIEQEPLPLGVGTERQHRQNFIQRFPLADQFFRRGAVG